MSFSVYSALALQRHYVGALSKPATTWLEPVPAAQLAFAGDALRVDDEGCLLDFGTVDMPRGEWRSMRMFVPGTMPVSMRVSEAPPWVETELDGGRLVVRITDDSEGEHTGTITLWIRDERGARLEKLRVHADAQPRQPMASISFDGDAVPAPFVFEDGDTYTISVTNRNSVPLIVALFDLPEWLELTVDGCTRGGPLPGPFFERKAPFVLSLRPRLLGRHEGALRMRTNDRQSELRDVMLPLSAEVVPLRPHVRAIPPAVVETSAKNVTVHASLENWSRTPAQVAASVTTQCAAVPAMTRVPAARRDEPGTADLPIRIAASRLAAGAHVLVVSLQIDDGEPARCSIPVRIDVTAIKPRRRFSRTETMATLFALLFLAIVLAAAARGWS
jgi:hypothetical protein